MTLAPRHFTRDHGPLGPDGVVGDVVLGDDWVAPDDTDHEELQDRREKRRWLTFRSSPLTQKIVTFNLIALVILVAGILHLNDSYRSLAAQRASELAYQSKLIASLFEAHSELGGDLNDAPTFLENLYPGNGMAVFVFDPAATLLGSTTEPEAGTDLPATDPNKTVISDALAAIWNGVTGFLVSTPRSGESTLESQLATLVPDALDGTTRVETNLATEGGTVFAAASPVRVDGIPRAVVTVTTPAGEIDALARAGRERVLQMFIVAILVSVGLSLVLASTISNPLADLADAAEMGRDRDARKFAPGRIRIPDLTARPDEIGRLSAALRGMVSALYSRIDANEQFAADVAHEVKNPLASLRSAVGTLRVVKRDDQRDKLLDVIEHDVRRLDRLVSDISNASRLDSELVKEEEVEFNLLKMLDNLNQFLGEDAGAKGVDYITDMPDSPILMHGLEPRLAQVFVNLITNAISFCEEGDAIRVWVRKRENRVLVVVEDTGPGIPEQALTKIFKRFYSERPSEHFGNNSGLGLAISKQIVEAHGGVIWAENIRPTASDVGSEPLGARFVVGLPV